MVIEQSGNTLYINLPRRDGQIELITRKGDNCVEERLRFIPAGILWLRLKQSGITTIEGAYGRIGLKAGIYVPKNGLVELTDVSFNKNFDEGVWKARFSWDDNGALVALDTKNP